MQQNHIEVTKDVVQQQKNGHNGKFAHEEEKKSQNGVQLGNGGKPTWKAEQSY